MNRLQIINKTLAKLGQDPVNALNAPEKRLKTALTFFDGVRDELMESYPWNFCTARAEIYPAAYEDENGRKIYLKPPYGYKYQYRLPKDFLRLLDCAELNYSWCGSEEYPVIEGCFLLADAAGPLHIRYCRSETNEIKWPPLFVNAFCAKLAYELCPNVEQSKADRAMLFQDFAQAVAQAKRVNAMQNPSYSLPPTDFELGRYGV